MRQATVNEVALDIVEQIRREDGDPPRKALDVRCWAILSVVGSARALRPGDHVWIARHLRERERLTK